MSSKPPLLTLPTEAFRVGEYSVQLVPDEREMALPIDRFLPGLSERHLIEAAEVGTLLNYDPDTRSILLNFNCALVRRPGLTILVDTGLGNDKERLERPSWSHRRAPFLERLAALGVGAEDVDLVVNTHLHADHVGFNTSLTEEGWVPTFPKARYLYVQAEFEHWDGEWRRDGDERLLYGAFADSVMPIARTAQLQVVASDHRIEDGLYLEPAPGHTPGNAILNVRSGGQHLIIAGDTFHHPIQFAHPALSSAFCEDPVLAGTTRRDFLERHAGSDRLVLLYHGSVGRAERVRGDRFRFVPANLD